VDFEKAFDKVWREALWYKLLLNNINGKMYRLILNTYDTVNDKQKIVNVKFSQKRKTIRFIIFVNNWYRDGIKMATSIYR
jgi:hypothetical protein